MRVSRSEGQEITAALRQHPLRLFQEVLFPGGNLCSDDVNTCLYGLIKPPKTILVRWGFYWKIKIRTTKKRRKYDVFHKSKRRDLNARPLRPERSVVYVTVCYIVLKWLKIKGF